MLFTTKVTRLDTGTAISYLTILLREPYQSDWLKMVHLLKYARGTKDLPLITSADNSGMIKWYIDGSHAAKTIMMGHTGGRLTM